MLKALAIFAGWIFRPIPSSLISKLICLTLQLLSLGRSPRAGIWLLLDLERRLYAITGQAACRYGDGIHPKHSLTQYHKYFCNRLQADEKVIDIGCGNGALAYDMAKYADAAVTGIELNKENYKNAIQNFKHPKIRFVCGDVLNALPEEQFDVAVMSNVLEHFDKRVEFILKVQESLKPKRWLFRVPIYQRDWRVAMMDELKIDYRLDPTHFIEYLQEDFIEELKQAGLYIVEMEVRWGEIWCVAKSI